MRYLLTINLLHRKALALVAAGALIVSPLPARAEWRHARGDSANSSFARVNTAPAIRPRVSFYAGPVAPGANPVIGPNGTVYVGNLAGELRAFHADGTPYWKREIAPGTGAIFAAPVVGADGSVYVVSTIHHEDTKDNESFLHKFNESGAYIFNLRFPKSKNFPFTDGGATTAPPNIWRWNGTEAIIVPAVYRGLGRQDVSLVAFSPLGEVLALQQVEVEVFEITGGGGFPLPLPILGACMTGLFGAIPQVGCAIISLVTGEPSFKLPTSFALPLSGAGVPLPPVAIPPDPRVGPPLVMATDRRHDKVVYLFSGSGFVEVARNTNTKQRFVTPPVAHGNNTMVGTLAGNLTFTGPNFNELPGAGPLGTLTAAPTVLSDGSLAVVSREGTVTRLGGLLGSQQTPGGQSIVSAAASCTHVFVSTTEALFTFNTKNMQQVAALPLSGGGLSAPVIGLSGEVYAMASGQLFAFPGPPLGGIGSMTACDVIGPSSQF